MWLSAVLKVFLTPLQDTLAQPHFPFYFKITWLKMILPQKTAHSCSVPLVLDFHVCYSDTANTLHTCMQSANLGRIWENTTGIGPLLALSYPGKHTLGFFSPESHFSAVWSAICASRPGMLKESKLQAKVVLFNNQTYKRKSRPQLQSDDWWAWLAQGS